MDRSADNLGQTINNIQRDLEELKSSQGDGSGGGGGGGGTEYFAGNGINISDDTISVDTSVVATQSDLPTKTSDLTNDGADGTSTYVEADELATVATSGSYNDLSNKPTIPNPTDYYWANVKVSSTSSNYTTPTFRNTSYVGDVFPHLGGNGVLTLSSQGWTSSDGTIAIDSGAIRPANSKTTMNIGSSNNKWQHLYMSGNIYKGSYTITIPSATGTLALTSDLDAKVNVQSVILDNQTTTILEQVKALGVANKSYGRFTCTYDGASANISDKPTGSTNASFVCVAYSTRRYNSNSYTYQVLCWVQSDTNPYRAVVTQDTTEISWSRVIPTVNNGTLTIQKNGTTVQTFTANQSSAATANITVPTKTSDLTNDGSDGNTTYVEATDVMTGATSSTAGTGGLVPAPSAGDQEKYLRGDGTWQPAGSSSDIPDGAVTTPKLATGAVTNVKIADSTIQAGKIDWSSFGCIESSFYFKNQADGTVINAVTNKGTQIKIAFISNGAPYILDGADTIQMIDVRTAAHFTQNRTNAYEIFGISSGATVYTRCFRQFPGNSSSTSSEVATNQSWSLVVDGITGYGGSFASVGSNTKNSFFAEYTITKDGSGGTCMFGKAGAGGSLTSISFETQITAVPNSMMPAIFQAQAENYIATNFSYIKIYETNS